MSVTLLTACAAGANSSGSDGASPATRPTATLAPDPSTTTSVPARPNPWAPTANEPVPELKVAAARAVEELLNYEPGQRAAEAAAERVAALGLPAQLAMDAAPLLADGARGRAEVVYPQLGGLTGDAASVMVVTRIRVSTDDGIAETTRTLDVRLNRNPLGWRAESIASLGSAPPAAPQSTDGAPSQLPADAIDLPDSALWDLRSGNVDGRIVALLRELAAVNRLSVAVLASGHPANVFGRDVLSNHTVGRGVDIWAVDGVPVAEQQTSPILRAIVDKALELGVTEVGAPFDTDGPGGRVFTNTVHRDHLHLAFESSSPAAPRS